MYTPVAERHIGILNSGFRLKYTGAIVYIIGSRLDYLIVDGIEVHSGLTGNVEEKAIYLQPVNVNNKTIIRTCLVTGNNASGAQGIYCDNGPGNYQIFNNFIFGFPDDEESAGIFLNFCDFGSYSYISCNSVFMAKYGIRFAQGDITVKSNAVFDCADSCFGSNFNIASDYNCSSDNTAPGTNALINKVSTNNFTVTTPGSENLHILNQYSDIFGTGVDLCSDPNLPVLTDIDGQIRDRLDIGADIFGTVAHDDTDAVIIAKKIYSVFKTPLTIITCVLELLEVMIDPGDYITIHFGNPQVEMDILVIGVNRSFGDRNRVMIKGIAGGYQFDEDEIWGP